MLNLRKNFYRLIEKEPKLCKLMKSLERHNHLYLLGGAVRNFIENGYRFNYARLPRDFDFVVEHKNGIDLENIVETSKAPFQYNGFGGYKFKFNAVCIDIWKIENTWAFTHTSLKKSKDNLIKSVFLNIDGIVYDFHKNSYYKEIYDSAIANNEISIVLEENPKLHLNLLRSMILSREYNMHLSKRIKTMLKESNQSEENFVGELFSLQKKRYNKVVITLADMEEIVNGIDWNERLQDI